MDAADSEEEADGAEGKRLDSRSSREICD
jgi:hypothetical protein